MTRYLGTIARGIRMPIFNAGDNLVEIIPQAMVEAARESGFELQDRDVLAITESVVARSQGNYATTADIAEDLRQKLAGRETLGLTLPILSRNRFSILLKGIAAAVKEVYIQLSYPADEVGNHLFSADKLVGLGINPWEDVLDEEQFKELFGESVHPFTGMDYVTFYRQLVEEQGAVCHIIFANDCRKILAYTDAVLVCDVHTRADSKQKLRDANASLVLGLDDILNSPAPGRGYNEKYGLLGSNKADENRVKLFPRDCQDLVDQIAAKMRELSGRQIEVMIYGDGAFKDPVGRIWELADPVVSPAYTPGLEGTPSELKLKYLADNEFGNLSAAEQRDAITQAIKQKHQLVEMDGGDKSEGTTPRRLTDLLGSLADLTSGSGDKGTPVVYIQGYFDSYSD